MITLPLKKSNTRIKSESSNAGKTSSPSTHTKRRPLKKTAMITALMAIPTWVLLYFAVIFFSNVFQVENTLSFIWFMGPPIFLSLLNTFLIYIDFFKWIGLPRSITTIIVTGSHGALSVYMSFYLNPLINGYFLLLSILIGLIFVGRFLSFMGTILTMSIYISLYIIPSVIVGADYENDEKLLFFFFIIVTFVGGFLNEISSRQDKTIRSYARKIKETLQAREKKFGKIIDEMQDAYYELDPAGSFTFFNKGLQNTYQYPKEELMGMNYSEYTTEESSKNIAKMFFEIWETGEPKLVQDHEIIVKDGQKRYVELSANLMRDTNNKPIGFFGIGRDVTEHREAEKKLRESEEKFRDLVENISDAIYLLDKNGLITYVSPVIESILGYSPSEIIGKHFAGFIHEEDISEHKLDMDIISTASSESLKTFEIRLYTRSGETRWVRISSRPIFDGGKVSGLRCVLSDIHESKIIQQKLQQSQKIEAIGTLAGGIAHDFNNILSSVIGYTELAADDAPKESVLKNNLKEVLVASTRAKDLVQQILTFSRQTEQELKPVQVNLIAKEAVKFLRATLPSTITIRQNIRSESLTMADPTQIHQVIVNLCTNAAYAMQKDGGIMDVILEDVEIDQNSSPQNIPPGKYLNLSINDTGSGISPSILNRIFDPFYTTKPQGEGTGLGLSVVHGIITSLGGKIIPHSEPGKGSSFKVYFPVIKRRVELENKKSKALPRGKESILLIDDEVPMTKVGKKLLESLGYRVETSTKSIEALKRFKASPENYDLVITDLTMPDLTGDKLAVEMKKIKPDIPVLLYSGFADKIEKDQTLKKRVDACITKPFRKYEIASVIRKVLDQ